MAALISGRSRADWLERMEGLDACFVAVSRYDELAEQPPLAARKAVVWIDGVSHPAPAPRFSCTPSAIRMDQRCTLPLDQAMA